MNPVAVRGLTVPGRLSGVSFELRPRSLVALVGPNGSGKSTLLQAAAGLLSARGDVELDGRPLQRIAVLDRARRLAWVPQEARFAFGFSVREVVAQGRYMWADDPSGVDEALAAFDLRDLAERPVTHLSGGERQRVSLARAVATGAALQLWDEPISQLDARHALEVLALARRLAQQGAALLLSLHDLRLAHAFDRVLLLHRGDLLADGPPEETLTPAVILEVFGVRASRAVTFNLELPMTSPARGRAGCPAAPRGSARCRGTDAKHEAEMKALQKEMRGKMAAARRRKGLLIVHTGDGKGKTSAALGMLLRSLGHGFKCAVVQFIKGGRGTAESLLQSPLLSWDKVGEGFTWDTQSRERDTQCARAGWELVLRHLADPELKFLLLDELNVVLSYEYLRVEEVLEALRNKREDLHVVVTGRGAPPALIEAADLVTEMKEVKHPFKEGIRAQPGIEF